MVQDELKDRFTKIQEMLKEGKPVFMDPSGNLTVDETENGQIKIKIPKGKLASYYWYEDNPVLLDAEKEAMKKFFPQFDLEKLPSGKLMWVGTLISNRNNYWVLAAVYQNNHPDNNTYSGSIRVYAINPDLNQLFEVANGIPHVLEDENGLKYLCTVDMDNFHALSSSVTSAASALSWAGKWIYVFESWINGQISLKEFADETY